MHSANTYLSTIGKLAAGSVLSSSEQAVLEQRLKDDARDYYQAALVSFLDGLRSIPTGFFSWSTVKLYYSVFYALRARLAMSGHCVFYDGSKPRHIDIVAGTAVSNLKGTTHKCVIQKFSSTFTNDFFLSQEIDFEQPIQWFMNKREDVNYKLGRFTEPIVPSYMVYAATTGVRLMLSSYEKDDVYVHSVDHAIVAFPYRLLLDLRRRLLDKNIAPLVSTESDFLVATMRDRAGPITALSSLIA